MSLAIDQIRLEASNLLDAKRRSELGQYMTPSGIAEFMASLFSYNGHTRLLDAGAGVGSLTSAFLDKALESGTVVEVDAWEIDETLGKYLGNTLDDFVRHGNGKIEARLHATDFIEDSILSLQFEPERRYTHAILNPPYKKISSHSRHRKLLRTASIETVNLYTAFVALAVLMMKQSGEVVAIIPRSFCNGSYYRPFRELILRTCSIRQLHLFESRSEAFRDDEVLQENIIIHLVKGEPQGAVVISTSRDGRFSDYREASFDAHSIVKPGDPEQFIHIPAITGRTNLPACCTHNLQDIGLEVCTGPVVDFRLKDYWRDAPSDDTVPLLYPHHFTDGSLHWPKPHKKPNALLFSDDVRKWLMPRGHYVLVKRFTSKEEPRRLVAYHLAPDALDSTYIGFENHWNIFHVGKHGLDEGTARGLTVFLNSTVLDEYFRMFSGHTQVNATDLRNMRYPSREQLRALGQRIGNQPADQACIDQLMGELGA